MLVLWIWADVVGYIGALDTLVVSSTENGGYGEITNSRGYRVDLYDWRYCIANDELFYYY